MPFRIVVLFLTAVGTSALKVVKSQKSPVIVVVEKLRESAQKIEKFQTGVSARRLDSHGGGGGMMDPKCQEACPKTMDMLTDMMKAMSATSTTPAPGTEMQSIMGALCPHAETLTCLGSEAACKDESTESMSMITCFCECPGLMALASGGDSMEAMCSDPGALDCLFAKESCSPIKDMLASASPGMNAEIFRKGFMISCAREKLDCDGKLENTGECAGDVLGKWSAAGCEEDVTETCCPWAETLLGCMGAECLKLQSAMYKLGGDAGDTNSKKELEGIYKLANTCSKLDLPASDEEVDAIVTEKTSSGESEPPATGFAYYVAPMFAATAVCAVVA
eukprot:gnl/MRDRNA2_/MRDRNA2_65629_c0_seq1.p1 gnl/MRDRNA2_/MRDRNA2_65629_c0~~gnl/MRDRNA2_/MRDRNA2_65629_c0_seq1.p1  ORF type:complete len:335 (+),score=66.50 gnl/MRDRNA2_/MRDRNA2_65629_c0_seq1:74-1078(+)